MEIDDVFKAPATHREWSVRTRTRRLTYKLQELTRGDLFGHEEMLQDCERKCKVYAKTHCSLLYANKNNFMKDFPPQLMDKLRETMIVFDVF